jgi:hypothetical protein
MSDRKSLSSLTLLSTDISITSEGAKTSKVGSGQDLAVKCYLPLAMTDAALFHALLCGSALFFDIATGRGESPERFRHMTEAVHLLSARLQDPRSELSDSTIVAVAHLADFEASTFGCGERGY